MARTAPRSMSLLKRFASERRGATAVEFALIAAPFMALLFAIMELGLVFMVSTSLENATDTVSRKIRTGELQTAGGTKTTFENAICAEITWLGSDCTSNLHVDVRTFPKFTNVTIGDPTTEGAFDEDKTAFDPGAGESIVLVRTYYEWSMISPLLNSGLKNMDGGKRLISSTATFRNEPYDS